MAACAPMAALERHLNVVNISLALPASGTVDESRVVFEIMVDGEQVGLLEATVSEVGLPLNLAKARNIQSTESEYRIPNHVAAALSKAVQASGNLLWLSFPQPSGYLPIVPWESLLQSRLQVPILRLSYTEVQPVVSLQSLDVIVCFSFPAAKVRSQLLKPDEVINYYFDHVPENIRQYTTFHVFGDAGVQHILNDVRLRQAECKIKVYDPGQAFSYDVPERDPAPKSSTDLESPWLLWMRDAMGSCSADLVHFFCHGYLGREDGFLCFSQSPIRNDDEEYSRFVGARQICTFLDQVGAWSVAYSSQPGNYSIAGLRLLQDQIARIRPGPVLFHDMLLDPNAVILNLAYQYAYAIEEAQAPASPAISLYCHPDWAMPAAAPYDESEQLLNQLTLAGKMQSVFESGENTPSWIASGQRALERSVAQLISNPRENQAEILQTGKAEALKFAADVFEKHARSFGFGGKGGHDV